VGCGLWVGDKGPTSAFYRYVLIHATPLGGEAVILFFVLSGFVLALPSINGKPQTYLTFITRRIFRIYVPYLAALAISVAGCYWLNGIVTRSEWFHDFWSEPVNWRLVCNHVLFVIVLLFCVHLLYGRIPLRMILLLTFILSLVVSRLSYRFIELPSMSLGRKISNAFRSPSGA
jgi:peptidoglycan/LPS O-acetylase OafA/YrhL